MGELKLPQLWFGRRNTINGEVYEECFNNRNFPYWDKTAIEDLHIKAHAQINDWNTTQTLWEYSLLGWRLNEEAT